MEIDSGDSCGSTEEEANVHRRSRWRGNADGVEDHTAHADGKRFASYKDFVIGDS